jgi:hypothetical protein
VWPRLGDSASGRRSMHGARIGSNFSNLDAHLPFSSSFKTQLIVAYVRAWLQIVKS